MKTKEIKRQKLGEGAVVLLIATVLVKLIGALFKIPLSSNAVLGDLGFGYFSSAYDLFSPIYTLAVSGFPVAISRIVTEYAAQNRLEEADGVFRVSKRLFLNLGIIASLSLLVLIFPFVRLADKSGQSIYSMLAVVPSFAICFLSSAYRGYFEGRHNMSIPAVSNIIEALCKLILGLSFAIITLKVTQNTAFAAAAAMLGITVGTLLSLLYLRVSYKHCDVYRGENFYTDKKLAKKVLLISLPIVLASMSGSLVALIDAITVRWQLSHFDLTDIYSLAINEYKKTMTEDITSNTLPTFLYGIRSKAFTLYNLVPTLTVSIGISAIPTLTDANTKGEKATVIKGVNSVLKYSAFISIPVAAGFLAIGREIMSFLYSNGVSSEIGGKMLIIYGVAVAFSGVLIPLTCVLQALEKQREAFYNVAIGLLIKLALNLSLTSFREINIFGAVWSTLVCNVVILILHFAVLFRVTGKELNFVGGYFKILLSALFCFVTAKAVTIIGDSKLITLVAIMSAGIVYLLCLRLFKVFSKAELTDFLGSKGEKQQKSR